MFLSSAITILRYRSAKSFYDFSEIGDDFDWFELADSVRNYGGLLFGLALSVTQVMTLTDPLNMMLSARVWALYPIKVALVNLLHFIGYDSAYKHAYGTD